jgi:hypothetical protein
MVGEKKTYTKMKVYKKATRVTPLSLKVSLDMAKGRLSQ